MLTNKTLWIVLLVLWIGGSTWWHVCRIKQRCLDDVFSSADASDNRPVLTIADGDRFRLAVPNPFRFARSDASANLNHVGGSLRPLTDYLRANPGRTLTITGYYDRSERNASGFASLGLARAESIRQHLIRQGGRAASLQIRGRAVNAPDAPNGVLTTEGDSLYGGLGFAFAETSSPAPTTDDLPDTEDELAAAETFTSVFEPINLYFSLGGSKYIKTPETKQFFDEAARYLAAHKDKKLLITGYTDDRGPEEVNQRLSRERANSVRLVLRQWHIDAEQLIVDAKGEDDPRTSNDTREGRKANRRVTIVVQ